MYAVILNGGKQYRIQEGDVVRLEMLPEEVGATVNFDQILLVGDGSSVKLGQPFVKDGKVSGTVLAQGRDKKISIIKFRRRKHHEKWQGHRQYYTDVKITEIK